MLNRLTWAFVELWLVIYHKLIFLFICMRHTHTYIRECVNTQKIWINISVTPRLIVWVSVIKNTFIMFYSIIFLCFFFLCKKREKKKRKSLNFIYCFQFFSSFLIIIKLNWELSTGRDMYGRQTRLRRLKNIYKKKMKNHRTKFDKGDFWLSEITGNLFGVW